jgi:quinol monooxygenase YgiN
MEHWYVYYKVPAAEVDTLAPRVRAMVATLAAAHGVRGHLARRVDEPPGQVTLMEVYDDVRDAQAFGAALAAAARAAGLAPDGAGRRVERFAQC